MLEIASTGNTVPKCRKDLFPAIQGKEKGTTIIRADGDISVTNASGEKIFHVE